MIKSNTLKNIRLIISIPDEFTSSSSNILKILLCDELCSMLSYRGCTPDAGGLTKTTCSSRALILHFLKVLSFACRTGIQKYNEQNKEKVNVYTFNACFCL